MSSSSWKKFCGHPWNKAFWDTMQNNKNPSKDRKKLPSNKHLLLKKVDNYKSTYYINHVCFILITWEVCSELYSVRCVPSSSRSIERVTWDRFFRAGHKAKSEHFHAEAEFVNIMAIFSIRSSHSLVHINECKNAGFPCSDSRVITRSCPLTLFVAALSLVAIRHQIDAALRGS